jgi:hypothetical protein
MKSGAPAKASSRSANSCRSRSEIPAISASFAVENVERPGTDRRRASLQIKRPFVLLCNARWRPPSCGEAESGTKLRISKENPCLSPNRKRSRRAASTFWMLPSAALQTPVFTARPCRISAARRARPCPSRARERRPVLTGAGDAPLPAARELPGAGKKKAPRPNASVPELNIGPAVEGKRSRTLLPTCVQRWRSTPAGAITHKGAL